MEDMNNVVVEDVIENLEEIPEVAEGGNLKKVAIGAGAAVVVTGIVYGTVKLIKKGAAAIKRRKLRKAAEASIEEDFEDFEEESYEEQVQSIHEND